MWRFQTTLWLILWAIRLFGFQRALKITSGIGRLRKSSAEEIESVKLRLVKIESTRKKYLATFENDRLDARAVTERLKELEAQETAFREQTTRLENLTRFPDVGLWDIEDMIQKVHEAVRRQDNPQLLRRFLNQIIESVTLDGNRVVIRAKEEGFAGLVTKSFGNGKEWQPIVYAVYKTQHTFIFSGTPFQVKTLRFNPAQAGEWLHELHEAQVCTVSNKAVTTASELGISRTRIIQFLNVMRIPADLRGRLKGMADVTEARLRSMVQMNPLAMRVAVGRRIGIGVLSQAG